MPSTNVRSHPTDNHRKPRLLLIGAGHAHLHLLQQRSLLSRFNVTLVDPGAFWYSGLASSVLAGDHPASADRIDPAAICRARGIALIRARLDAISTDMQTARLSNGASLPFDRLGLNLGSAPALRSSLEEASGDGRSHWQIKPIPQLLRLRRSLERRFILGQPVTVEILGAGASGVEIACAIDALGRRHRVADDALNIHLRHRGSGPLPDAPERARRYLLAALERRKILVEDSRHGRHDLASDIVDATGLGPPRGLEGLGLPTIDGRGIAVDPSLKVQGTKGVFASGDCAALVDLSLPRLGVHGVRQGPVLAHNLLASLDPGARLIAYRPPARALSIINLGQGEALALFGNAWWGGWLAHRLKRYLDLAFMQRIRSLDNRTLLTKRFRIG